MHAVLNCVKTEGVFFLTEHISSSFSVSPHNFGYLQYAEFVAGLAEKDKPYYYYMHRTAETPCQSID